MQKPITEADSTNQAIFNYVGERGIEGNENIYKIICWMLTTTVYRLKKKLWQTQDLSMRRCFKNSKTFLSVNQHMENNSFTKKVNQKVKSSYITSRNFRNFKRKSERLRK